MRGEFFWGDTCVDITIKFLQEVDNEFLPDTLTRKAIFYKADIKLDAIISYPWLRKKKMEFSPPQCFEDEFAHFYIAFH